jgi:GH25 family lysozyme M1 (1,4-beta-N-acetylmuramidase)
VAAAYLAQVCIDACVRAKICCRREYYTMVRKKMKAFIGDLHQEVAKDIIYCII